MTPISRAPLTIILATANPDKVRELRPLLEGIDPCFSVISLAEAGIAVDIEETETTLEGNAMLKANAIFNLLNGRFPAMIAFADDTGLEVNALGGAPGVYSARYAPVANGEKPTYRDNVAHLLNEMEGEKDRSARFRTVIALKGIVEGKNGTTGIEETIEGLVEGTLTTEADGSGGFGYDPIFMVTAAGKTYGRMSGTEKNSLSHRALATKKAIAFLHTIL
ncbi:RdgB/HAM1 family non-canonical purine NTP pyrophosphatase [Chlorobium phaeovibrioides]|uniref:RdgB/HAM1 family non-canonical purine NTP pyrophosphatase n=1 Tax=Chlorobium phaeovibrioides TaxID=1094 RepID=UPI00123078A3|nr:RdgB/HAM1 family non-canonical purine NTP pyrophosphatase [Chlorobium phaeovibrioides]QEQ57328.1 RdgB/HAM1 family non-canonical purine NTP pyrophosphatase [Chlorobium phaeovibrioides]